MNVISKWVCNRLFLLNYLSRYRISDTVYARAIKLVILSSQNLKHIQVIKNIFSTYVNRDLISLWKVFSSESQSFISPFVIQGLEWFELIENQESVPYITCCVSIIPLRVCIGALVTGFFRTAAFIKSSSGTRFLVVWTFTNDFWCSICYSFVLTFFRVESMFMIFLFLNKFYEKITFSPNQKFRH